MNTRIDQITKTKVFTDRASAQQTAHELQKGDSYGWSYRVEIGIGFEYQDEDAPPYLIAVHDEIGAFVSYWRE